MNLNLNELLKTGHRIKIVLPNGTIIKGFVNSQFTFAGAASWGDSPAADAVDKANTISEGVGTIKGLVGKEGGALSSGVHPYAATGKAFQGFTVPTIEIPLIFVALTNNAKANGSPFAKDVRAQYLQLLEGVYPSDVEGTAGMMMEKPWKHKFNPLTLKPVGQSTCSVEIGAWFKSRQFWLITSVSGTFSKEPTIDGLPLYANVNVSLTAYRQPKYSEVQSWFK